MSLIVIHDDHGIIHASLHFRKYRIGRNRAFHMPARRHSIINCRPNLSIVFIAEQPPFAAVGV